jgi:hypothetical protein
MLPLRCPQSRHVRRHLFDAVDFSNLELLLQEKNGILSFATSYGEPVQATIYYYPSILSAVDIKNQLDKKIIVRTTDAGEEKIETGFTTASDGRERILIHPDEYLKRIFINYDDTYDDYENYDQYNLAVFRFSIPEGGNPELRKYLDYLSSHLSGIGGIVRFSIRYDHNVTGYIYYSPFKITEKGVISALRQEKLSFFVSDSEKEEIVNPFHIPVDGKSHKASEISIDKNGE